MNKVRVGELKIADEFVTPLTHRLGAVLGPSKAGVLVTFGKELKVLHPEVKVVRVEVMG